ncbi:MAG: hypothetical protein ACE5EB_01880 [Thermodesulfobacteriota bacterium]
MEKWFFSGGKMPDGTPISVAAHNDIQEIEYVKRGWKPVEAGKKRAAGRPKKVQKVEGSKE